MLPAKNIDHAWGTCSTYTDNWFNLDSNRHRKESLVEFHLKEGGLKPTITPENPKAVIEILNRKLHKKKPV
jgi:hypothetical protein